MSDYKQTRDAAGKVTSRYDKMLRNLDDDDLASPLDDPRVKALVEALREIELEYDPSEDGQNALTMYEIARAALSALEKNK